MWASQHLSALKPSLSQQQYCAAVMFVWVNFRVLLGMAEIEFLVCDAETMWDYTQRDITQPAVEDHSVFLLQGKAESAEL